MCEGLSRISGPIPPHPLFLKEDTLLTVGPAPSSTRSRNGSLCEGPSKLSGPFVSHYKNEDERAFDDSIDYNKNPRVRDDGKANYDQSKNSRGMALLLHLQGRALPSPTFKIREAPKNHIAANASRIKRYMRVAKEKEQQKEREKTEKNPPVKALWKSDKYKEVQSKLKEMLIQAPEAPREQPKREFLRAHSRTSSISRPHTARPASSQTAQLPLDTSKTNNSSADKKFKSKDDIDFVRHNQKFASQAHLRPAPSVEQLKMVQEKLNHDLEQYKNKVKGKVPKYLEQRKEENRKEQEEYIKNMPDPDQPPGHRKLPEDERVKTLTLLKETHQKLISELNSLPLRNDTFRLRTTKSEMEKRLIELDEAIKIFSKPKVFVKVE